MTSCKSLNRIHFTVPGADSEIRAVRNCRMGGLICEGYSGTRYRLRMPHVSPSWYNGMWYHLRMPYISPSWYNRAWHRLKMLHVSPSRFDIDVRSNEYSLLILLLHKQPFLYSVRVQLECNSQFPCSRGLPLSNLTLVYGPLRNIHL